MGIEGAYISTTTIPPESEPAGKTGWSVKEESPHRTGVLVSKYNLDINNTW